MGHVLERFLLEIDSKGDLVRLILFVVATLLGVGVMHPVQAEVKTEIMPEVESSPTPSLRSPVPKKSRGKIKSEKEAEGTKAPNRFDPDIVPKSKYELDGQPLEVDTD